MLGGSRFGNALRAAGFEVLNEVLLNQVLVSFGTPEQTQATIAAIQQDGTCWCGSSVAVIVGHYVDDVSN